MTTYGTIFAKSFSKKEQKKLECGAIFVICCFMIMIFVFCTVDRGRLPILNLELSVTAGFKMLMKSEEISKPKQSDFQIADSIHQPVLFRNFSNSRSDVYEMNGDIRIHGNSSTIFIISSSQNLVNHHRTTYAIRPYARKTDQTAMRKATNLKIKEYSLSDRNIPSCSRYFTVPGIVFSTGGYAGNHFHDFTDVLVPLYLTSQELDGKVIFLITNQHSWWTFKYKTLLEKLSIFEVIDVDKENEVLCFLKMIVGLKANREFGIDPSEYSPHYSTVDFTRFLKSAYFLERKFLERSYRRPKMLIVSREKTRHLKNEGEIGNMARGLGFEVVVKEMGFNVSKVSRFVNSFDVMVGVHGAGLTNMVFLPENALVIQIVPFGLEFLARDYFQRPAKDMNLKYLEYRVSLEESSLLGKYPIDSEVYRDPYAIHERGFLGFRSIYLDDQDVKLDLRRFKKILLKAKELILLN